jgi:hypothetical protein
MQDDQEAVVVTFAYSQGLLNQLLQGVLIVVDLVLHTRFAVISLREDVGQPDRGQPLLTPW